MEKCVTCGRPTLQNYKYCLTCDANRDAAEQFTDMISKKESKTEEYVRVSNLIINATPRKHSILVPEFFARNRDENVKMKFTNIFIAIPYSTILMENERTPTQYLNERRLNNTDSHYKRFRNCEILMKQKYSNVSGNVVTNPIDLIKGADTWN
jgi:hypothetical protein